MKKKSRILAVLTASMMFGGGLVSCMGETDPTSPSTPNTQPTTPSPTTPDPDTSVTLPPVPKKVNVKFVFNNGDEDYVIEKETGEILSADEVQIPVYPKHSFVNWSTSNEFYKPYNFNQQLKANLTLYAIWSEEKITVSFNTNGGNSIDPVKGYPNDPLTLPTDVKKPNSVFAGWYLDKELTQAFALNVFPSKNTILYAKFTDNAQSEVVNITWSKGVEYYIPLVTNTYPRGEEVSFRIDFNVDYDASQAVVTANGQVLTLVDGMYTFIANGDTTIEVSNLVKKKVKLTFHGGYDVDGVEAIYSCYVTYGSNISKDIADGQFSRVGYVFADYYETDEYKVKSDFSIRVRKDLDFYAKWDIAHYNVTYANTFGAYNQNKINTITYFDDKVELLPLENYPDGLEFVGWRLDGKLIDAIPSGIDRDIELVAEWNKLKMEMNFVTGDPSIEVSSITGYFGDPLILPSDPTREGFYFAGWYLDPNYKTPMQYETWPANSAPINVFAKWSVVPENSSRIFFERADGVEINYFSGTVPTNGYVENGSTVNMTVRVKNEAGYSGTPLVTINNVICTPSIDNEGRYVYTFVVNLDTRVVFDGISQKKYSLTFYYNDGTDYSVEKMIGYDSYLTESVLISEPMRNGYTFTGWYLDPKCTVSLPLNTKINRNLNLYASWRMTDYVIRLLNAPETDYPNNTIVYNINSPTIILTDARREGYIFIGWFDENGREWKSIDPQNDLDRRNINLYARYSIIKYNVNIYSIDGSVLYDTFNNIEFDTPLKSFINVDELRVEGYSLNINKMYYDLDLKQKVDIYDKVLSNTNIYAEVDRKTYYVTFEDLTSSSYVLKDDLNTTIPSKDDDTYKKLFDGEYSFTLSHQLEETSTYVDRVYVIRKDGKRELVEVTNGDKFKIMIKSINKIIVERCYKLDLKLMDETSGNYSILTDVSTNPVYTYDELLLQFDKAIDRSHILYVGIEKDGVIDNKSLQEVKLSDKNEALLIVKTGMVFVIRERAAVNLVLDQSAVDIGLEILTDLSDGIFLGNEVTITFNMEDSEIKALGLKLYIKFGESSPKEILLAEINNLGPSIVFIAENTSVTLLVK